MGKGVNMKKVFRVCIVFLLVTGVFISAASASANYDIGELYMSISIPDNYMVFTRDTNANDPNLAVIGMDKETLNKQFTESDIYLDAIEKDNSTQIIIVMSEDSSTRKIFDLNLCTDEEKTEIAEEEQKLNAFQEAGVKYTGYTFYKYGQANFICFDIARNTDENTLNSRQYFTMINGQAISIIIYSSNGSISAEQEAVIKSAVDSISFSEVKKKPTGALTSVISWAIIIVIIAAAFGIYRYITVKSKKKKQAAVRKRM